MELLAKWQPMDVEDALELLGSKYKDYPKIRSYAVSRLQLASDKVNQSFHLYPSSFKFFFLHLGTSFVSFTISQIITL